MTIGKTLYGLMQKEYDLLKRAANEKWPPEGETYLLREEYDNIIYQNVIQGRIIMRMDQSTNIRRILLRLLHAEYRREREDITRIWIEPGYTVVKNGRVIWSGASAEEMVSFVIGGVMMRVERIGLFPQPDYRE